MAPKSNIPVRICGSKVRSGCRTCKQRHVKCDERRPICLRCEKGGRQCVYDQPPTQTTRQTSSHSQETELTARVKLQQTNLFGSPQLNSTVSLYGSYEVAEVSAVKNFATYLGKELAGCFSDDVWCHVIPRAAQHESSIWHAIVAVSTLNTSIRFRQGSSNGDPDVKVAIKQYSKAMRELNTRLESGHDTGCKSVVLLSCILFAIFECLQGRYLSALRHVNGGMKLLAEWGYDGQSDPQGDADGYINHTILQPFFLSLDSQAVQMGVGAALGAFSWSSMNDQMQIPSSFATVEEAHRYMVYIFNRLSHWSDWVEPVSEEGSKVGDNWRTVEGHILRLQLAAWDSAFDVHRKLLYPQPAILMLLIQRKVIQVLFDKDMDGPSEMEWDKYTPAFQDAVECAETYMRITAEQSQPHAGSARPSPMYADQIPPVMTLATDIVLPLFGISVKCRDSRIRRRALAMLKTCGRKEGMWDSQSCADMAEWIIETEEQSALKSGFIPEDARVEGLGVNLGEETGGEAKLKRKPVVNEDGCFIPTPDVDCRTW